MSEDIRISIDFLTHRKRKKLQRRLGAVGVLSTIDLWLSTAVQRPLGTLTGYSIEDIEMDANWEGEPGLFVETLLDIGFLDEKDGLYLLHNWKNRQGWVSESENRADKARFSRLAKINHCLYKEMKEKGIKQISKKEYQKIKDGATVVNDSLNESLMLVEEMITPAPAPAPSPSPAPAPNTSTDRNLGEQPKGSPDWCPHEKIRELYNSSIPELSPCLQRNKTFDGMTRARWKEYPERQNLEWWAGLFETVRESDFLMGKTKEGFHCTLDWIVRPTNMTKIINGNYKNRTGKNNGRFSNGTIMGSKRMDSNLEACQQFINGDK